MSMNVNIKFTCVLLVSFMLLACMQIAIAGIFDGVNIRDAEHSVAEKMSEFKKKIISGDITKTEVARKSVEFAVTSSNLAEKVLYYKGAIILYSQERNFVQAERAYVSMTNDVSGLEPKICAGILCRALESYSGEEGAHLAMIVDQNLAKSKILELNELLAHDKNNVLTRRKLGEQYVVLGDWGKALENFALSGGEYSRMAKAELENSDHNYKELGDFWWLESGDIADMLHEGYRIHARELYKLGALIP